MAVDIFLKIAGVDGESKDDKHKKEMDILAWSWGLSNSGSAQTGGGAGAGKVNVQDVSFTKWVDAATPKLVLACCNGTHYDEATLVVRKAGGSPVEYIKLNFAKFNLDYTPQDDKGAAGTAIPAGWDVAANKKL